MPEPMTPGGGGGTMQAPQPPKDILQQIRTGGYGTMPGSATPYSQALMGQGSEQAYAGMGGVGARGALSDLSRAQATAANVGRQGQMQEQQDQMFQQGLQSSMLRNQALQKLLALFGGGGGQGYQPGLNIPGPVTADPNILAGLQAKVGEEFSRPGGLQSQVQQLGARQGRYASGSTMGAQRQASLDRARAGAMTEAYVPAQTATVQGYEPALQLERIKAGAWQSQQAQMPQLLASIMRG